MQNSWVRKIGSLFAGLIWTFGLLSSTGFAQTDDELKATIERVLEKDEKSMAELMPLPPRSVVVMTKMLKDLPESGPHAVLFTVLGLKVEQYEAVLPEAELRDALKVLVEKKFSANVAIQDSNERVLKRISPKARIKKHLVELGVVYAPAPEERNWLLPSAAVAGLLLIAGIVFHYRLNQAKRNRGESRSAQPL